MKSLPENAYKAIASAETMEKLYIEFIGTALEEDGAKKMTDIDEQYTGSRPYCD